MPSCSQWPHNVRPAGYYDGAYLDREDMPKSRLAVTLDGEPAAAGERLLEALRSLPELDQFEIYDVLVNWSGPVEELP